jgi:peptidoglycan/xylan/chitin deacetylase (PgdA/CDA1 family)
MKRARARRDSRLPPPARAPAAVKRFLTRGRSLRWAARPRTSGPGLRILFYHRISPEPGPLAVSPKRFRDQMAFLASENYVVLDLVSAVSALRENRIPPRSVALTFDDGYLDFATHALPVLQHYDLPATVFVAAGLTDGSSEMTWFARQPPLLRSEQIVELDRDERIRFEAHSITHPKLTALDDDSAWREIAGSKAWLEDLLQRPVDAFSYPGGFYALREQRFCATAGFSLAVSCEPGANSGDTDPFGLHRIQVEAGDRLIDFRARVEGGHDRPLAPRALYRRLRYGSITADPTLP